MPATRLCISLSFAFFLFACHEDHFVPSRGLLDWDYFPLKEGDTYIYDYSKITYLGKNITPDSQYFQIKQEVISVEKMNDGSSVYTILSSKSNGPNTWEPLLYWTIRNEFDRSISIINNQEYVELQLPLLNGYHWEGQPGGLNCRDNNGFCDLYEVVDKEKEFQLGPYTFANTVRINKQDQEDPLQISNDILEYSIYAQGTGLVYWELKEIEYASCRNNQNPECCCSGDILCTLCAGEIEFGTIERKSFRERISL